MKVTKEPFPLNEGLQIERLCNFFFSFLVFSYFNSLYPLGGGIPGETFHRTVVLQQKN